MSDSAAGMKIVVSSNGPYYVRGGVPLFRGEIVVNDAAESVGWRELERIATGESYALCRCGHSSNKPLCDGTHFSIGFDGTETAERTPYTEAAVCTTGPGLKLLDARKLCAEARFCDRGGGIWNLIERCDDPDTLALVEEESALCPSGRYVTCDAETMAPHEPALGPSIWLIEDPQLGVSGGIWVRGGIPIESADGTPYEVRNRVTLCRCGASKNKPFCDGSHIVEKFQGR
ncbi:MAG: CDGSH iron-sulfur domain-containing protein [Actinomycetia bacterium]|nr:CDGSH iron-sulfur domain-containing protein [Actinomycetes bacterium]